MLRLLPLARSCQGLIRRPRHVHVFPGLDYISHQKQVSKTRDVLLNSSSRFQIIEERKDYSDLTLDFIKVQCRGRYLVTHRGCNVMKGPEDILIFQQFLWLIKPKTILELGTFSGGCALWMADTSTLYGNNCHVYSVDVDLSLIENQVKNLKPDNLTFIQGDCYAFEKFFNPEFLFKLPRPLILIDDAHVNTPAILQYIHDYLKPGDYIIVEDTHPSLPTMFIMDAQDPDYETAGKGKLEIVKDFLKEYKGQYTVDSFFTDFFGYNATWNMNAWIRKMY